MENLKFISNDKWELEVNSSDYSENYNYFSIKTTIGAIKNSEEKEDNPDNILQKLHDSNDENKLSPAMQEFVSALQTPSYTTISSTNWNSLDVLNIKLTNIVLVSLISQYCDIWYYPKPQQFYQEITEKLNRKWFWFKAIWRSLVFLKDSNLIILNEWAIKWVRIVPQKDESIENAYKRVFNNIVSFGIEMPNYWFPLYEILENQIKN